MTKEEIGHVLKELRSSCGMTQKEVADRIGRKQQVIGHWETGYAQPDANTLFTLCNIYGVTVDDAFGFQKNNNFSKEEYDHIKKYRTLDTHGKEMVDFVLNKEADRMTELKATQATVIDIQTRLEDNIRLIEYHHSASAGTGVFILGNEGVDQLPIQDTPENRKVDYAIKVSGNSMEPDYYDGDIVLVSQKVELNHGDVGIFIVNNNAYIKEYGEVELISRNPEADNIVIAEYDNIVCMGKVVGRYEA